MIDSTNANQEKYLSAIRLAFKKNSLDYELVVGKKTTTINELVGGCLEHAKMTLAKAPIFTFRFKDAEEKTNILALVSYPLKKDGVLRLLNKTSPIQRELGTEREVGYWSRDVGNDWAYMVSHETATSNMRKRLETKHAPDSVPGFAQFRPHVRTWLGALADDVVERSYPTNAPRKSMLPLIHFRISSGGQLEWLDNMVTPEVHAAILKGVAQCTWNLKTLSDVGSSVLDKFAGLATVTYAEPDLARLWPQKILGQTMSIAQAPVLVWQNKESFDLNTRFVGSLTRFVAQNN